MKRIAAIVLCLALMITSISQMDMISLAVGTPTITCESKECNPGDTVSVEVNLTNNPGIMYLEMTPTYSAELGTPTVQNGSIITDLTKGKQYVWVAENDVDTNGTLVTMNFKVDESVAPGDYSVSFNFRSAYNYDEESVSFTVIPATISVKAKPVPVTGLALDKTTATVQTGDETLTLTPIFTPETATNKNLTWDSADNSIATVANGVVTLIKKGVVTITATTEDGNYSASCVVTINCSHGIGHDVSAEDSTCIKHGHGAYTVCDECGEIIEGSDAELPLGDHVGGTANCQHKAVCTVCGKEYGELGDHNYTEIADKQYLKSAATCSSKAVYYKSCSVCGAKGTETFEAGEYDYTNHVGETYKKNQKEATCFEEGYTGDTYCRTCDREISKGESIPKNAHDPASVWTTDETYHWKVCRTVGCGNIIDKAPHSGGEATCTKKAVCSVCSVEYGEINPNNHKHTEVRDAKDATCCEAGYTGDTWCTDCETKIATGTAIPATGKHIDADSKWESDGTNHWHTCYFNTKFDVTAHSGGTATCHDLAECKVCGTVYGKLDGKNHVYDVAEVVKPTCIEKGYSLHTCKYHSDASYKDTYTDPLGHKIVDWTVTKEATTEETGIKTGKCTVCGDEITAETGKLVGKVESGSNKVEAVGDTTLYETVVLKTDKVSDKMSESEKADIQTKVESLKLPVENIKVAEVLDISLILRDTDDQGNSIQDLKYEPDGKIRVTIEIPETIFKNFTNVKLLHFLDDGTVDTVDYTMDGSKVVFETDSFSYFAFAGTPIVTDTSSTTGTSSTTDSSTKNDKNSPQTGDNRNIVLWVVLLMMSSCGILTLTVINKKEQDNL